MGRCSALPFTSAGSITMSWPIRFLKSTPPSPRIVTRVPPVAISIAVRARALPVLARASAAPRTTAAGSGGGRPSLASPAHPVIVVTARVTPAASTASPARPRGRLCW